MSETDEGIASVLGRRVKYQGIGRRYAKGRDRPCDHSNLHVLGRGVKHLAGDPQVDAKLTLGDANTNKDRTKSGTKQLACCRPVGRDQAALRSQRASAASASSGASMIRRTAARERPDALAIADAPWPCPTMSSTSPSFSRL